MKILIIILIIVLSIIFLPLRVIVLNPLKSLYYGIIDLYHYTNHKLYNKAKAGSMVCYAGHFGKGKTLTMCNDVYNSYRRYNNKKWFNGNKWLTNNVIVISNVKLTIPYIDLQNASQITSYMNAVKDINDDIYRIIYICIDEASVVLNSRSYKDNINPLLLNSLLTCRHYNTNFYYTSQKFKLVDALLRSVTQSVIQCNKCWRLSWLKTYNADELENVTDSSTVKPIQRRTYFCTNKRYSIYDTYATVSNLQKNFKAEDMLSTKEIIETLKPLNQSVIVNE